MSDELTATIDDLTTALEEAGVELRDTSGFMLLRSVDVLSASTALAPAALAEHLRGAGVATVQLERSSFSAAGFEEQAGVEEAELPGPERVAFRKLLKTARDRDGEPDEASVWWMADGLLWRWVASTGWRLELDVELDRLLERIGPLEGVPDLDLGSAFRR